MRPRKYMKSEERSMKTVNLGDPYAKRMTLRLSEPQMEFLQKISGLMGVSPSEYIRMAINTQMVTTGKTVDDLISGKAARDIMEKGMGGTSNENVKTDSEHIV